LQKIYNCYRGKIAYLSVSGTSLTFCKIITLDGNTLDVYLKPLIREI